jgi:hypothetical protein
VKESHTASRIFDKGCTYFCLGKGAKKKTGKSLVFCQTPLGPPPPPPSLAFFQQKNLPPFFLLKIASLMAETNFTLGPTSKTNKLPLLFLVIVVQNSQHKRAQITIQ